MMGLQAIKATPKDRKPVFPVDQDIGEMTTAHRAARQGVSSQEEGASIASATDGLLRRKTGEGLRRVIARTAVIAEVCLLWLFMGVMLDNGLCGESKTRAQAVVAPIEQSDAAQGKVSQAASVWDLGVPPILALEALQVAEAETKQGQALDQERDRAEAFARELSSVRNELEAANRQIAALSASGAVRSREPAADRSQVRMVEFASRTIEGKERSPEQISGQAVAATSGRSSGSELPSQEPRPTAREAASDLDPNVAVATELSALTSAASRSPVDEQRLLARANALLLQADISDARPVLEHALERGSARAAFMLAETYDARVLQSWRARGISGDLAKARELYERAQAGGIEDARERIETLK
jgi:hypothetical protein